MKKIATLLIIALAILGCKGDDDRPLDDNNPNLTAPIVNLRLNLNLPQYDPLKFPGNSLILSQQGIRGIIVYNVNNDLYTAFDLTDPNHFPNDCSRMTIEGVVATCPCENDTNSYDIVTGSHRTNENAYPMLQYRIQRTGDNITITN